MLQSVKRAKTRQNDDRRLNTPKTKQARVIAAAIYGKSQSEIERETGVARSTIRRIMSQSEVEALMASYRDQVLNLVPEAVEGISERLARQKGGKRKASEWLMVELLKGVKVFMGKTETDVHHIVDELHELTDEQLAEYVATGQYQRAKEL